MQLFITNFLSVAYILWQILFCFLLTNKTLQSHKCISTTRYSFPNVHSQFTYQMLQLMHVFASAIVYLNMTTNSHRDTLIKMNFVAIWQPCATLPCNILCIEWKVPIHMLGLQEIVKISWLSCISAPTRAFLWRWGMKLL